MSDTPKARQRLVLEYRHHSELTPYDNNPRLNEQAVPAVAASIREFGFRVPVVVDAEGTIVSGHTRVLAVQSLIAEEPALEAELGEIPVLVATDLTPEQLRAFRLVDNKVAEIATWDFDALAEEVSALSEVGIDLTGFGWTQEEIDCLHNVVSNDVLLDEGKPTDRDGINAAVRPTIQQNFSADGSSVRISWGALAFMVLREDFEAWNDELHRKHNYNAEAVIDDVAEQLGLLDAKRKRDIATGRINDAEDTAKIEAHTTV